MNERKNELTKKLTMPTVNDIHESKTPDDAVLSTDELVVSRADLYRIACAVVDAVLAKNFPSTVIENGSHEAYNTNRFTSNLLTVKEVAGILKLSVRKIWRMAAAGQLPTPIKIERSSRWIASEIEAYLSTVISNRKN